MYIKILGGLFLLCSSAAIGVLKAEELQVRVQRLQELKRMLVLLQGELRFHRAVLSEAFANVAERVESPFDGFLADTAKKLESADHQGFERVWSEMSGNLLKTEGFFAEDGKLFDLLGNSLGYLDLTMQMENLNLVLLQTQEILEKAKEQQEVKGKLYQMMGVTVGALLTLLII